MPSRSNLQHTTVQQNYYSQEVIKIDRLHTRDDIFFLIRKNNRGYRIIKTNIPPPGLIPEPRKHLPSPRKSFEPASRSIPNPPRDSHRWCSDALFVLLLPTASLLATQCIVTVIVVGIPASVRQCCERTPRGPSIVSPEHIVPCFRNTKTNISNI